MGKKLIVFCFSLLFISTSLFAGGWNNTLIGCRALGIGAAFSAVADDPSAIYYNPAGLSQLEQRLNFSVVGFYIHPTHEYTIQGAQSMQSQYNSYVPQVFFTYRMSDRVTVGFGAYVPYAGGGVDWSAGVMTPPMKSYLGVMSLTPSFSWRVSDKVFLGFNLNYYTSRLEINTLNEFNRPLDTEETGAAISAGFGLMVVPNGKLRLGLSVRGPAKMKLSGTTKFVYDAPVIGPVMVFLDSETEFNLPWDIEAGVSYRFNPGFLVSVSAQYSMWSALEAVDKSIKNAPVVGDIVVQELMMFKNILIMRAGAEYSFQNGLFLRGGFGWDRSATPPEYLSLNNIDVDKFTLLGGMGYRTGNIQIDFAYVYANGKGAERTTIVNGIPVIEQYNLNASIFGMGVSFVF